MPELPEVQTVVDGLKASITGAKILDIKILNSSSINQGLLKVLVSQTIHDIYRKGKFIIILLDRNYLVIHLRMTGQFFYYQMQSSCQPNPYDRVLFQLDKGTLVFRDVRKFGTMQVINQGEEILTHLGLDPTDKEFTFEVFVELVKSSKGRVKAFLLDQEKIAGLGNIYADEALFQSRIHPNSYINHLNQKSLYNLHKAIVGVLHEALENEGTSLGEGLGNYRHINGEGKNQMRLKVYGRDKLACLNCQKPLEKIKAAGRGTTFCPHCQILY